MGSNNSKTSGEQQPLTEGGTTKKKQQRYYRVPEARAKDRFDPQDVAVTSGAYEATIDKFDYLIVFPLTEGPYINPQEKKPTDSESDFISWPDITQIWMQAAPGTDREKSQAVENLKAYWKKRTGTIPEDTDTIRVNAWLTIAREAIVDLLTSRSGLQLKLSASARHIFCRVRVPIKLLELQADKENYRLQIKGEIDPGSEEFWNKEINGRAIELEEEQKLYEKDEAIMILEKLYRAGKISPADLGVNPDKETRSTWSRRVHALERIADRIPVWNKYVSHLQFKSDPHYRYLYQTYPSVRGKTLFRSKDRLYLTKSIIDKCFDFDVLADPSRGSRPVVHTIMALHDANRGERLTIDLLQRRWVTFWRPHAKEVGSPMVTHDAYEAEADLPFYLRPFAQPFSDIRDYFGEKLALYYVWFGYYTYLLLFPALLGIGMEALFTVRGYEDTIDNLDYPTYGFYLLVMTWSTIYKLSWEVESKAVALKWGTRGFESEEKDRPQFRADPDDPIVRSIINNRNVTNFPDHKRTLRVFGSYIVVFFAIVVDMAFIASLFVGEEIIVVDYPAYDYSWLIWAISVTQALAIKVGSNLFKPIARYLNDMENHRTETSYEDSLVSKVLIFELFNNFSALLFTAFGKGYLLDTCEDTCIGDLRILLYSIIIVRISFNIWDIIEPLLSTYIRETFYPENGKMDKKNDSKKDGATTANDLKGGGEDVQFLHDESDDNTQFMSEIDRVPYDGTFDDYAYAVFQFGYVNLFIIAMPVQALIALAENLIKIRTDAWKLCALTRRPHVLLAEDVGKWSVLMDMMCVLGVVTSVGIVCFTSPALDNYSTYVKFLVFLGGQQGLLLFKFFIHSLYETEPEWIQDIAARHDFVDEKWIKGYEDDDDDDLDLMTVKGHLDDVIDVDGFNLYDLRKGTQITEKEYQEMEQLEAKRRELLRELRYSKDKLKEVYKSESFNEITGIGETKHGLPLGRLSVKLLELQSLVGPEIENKQGNLPPVKIRVLLKSARQSASPPCAPFGPRGDSMTVSLTTEGAATLNQQLGPFAPIRTQDADVVFEIIDMSANASEASVATTSVKLRDLQDQLSHDLVLHMKIRQAGGGLRSSDARLFVGLKFEYSKVIPLRNRIYEVQDKLRQTERTLAALKAGKS